MAPADYKVKFKELKSRVGIDDVAYSLGYRLDRKAGVGRYIELVLGEGRDKRDTIIVSNRRDKASQTFFRRDGSKGDVVSFIRENLSSFNVIGLTEWQKIAKVMAQFANMPEPDYDRDRDYVRSASAPQVFDPSRYRVKELDAANIPRLFAQRGLSADTVKALAPFISLVSDRRNEDMRSAAWAATSRRPPAPIHPQRRGWPTCHTATTASCVMCSFVNPLLMLWLSSS